MSRKKSGYPQKVWTFLQSLEKHARGIQNACIYTLSNGNIERLNNKIKNIKRTGFGYRNFNNLRARILISSRLTENHYQPRPMKFEDETDKKDKKVA